jgi:hypothetical protein
MSELGDKFVAARFEKKSQVFTQDEISMRRARDVHDQIVADYRRALSEAREGLTYQQQLQRSPPTPEILMPGLAAAGTGAGLAAMMRTRSPGSISKALSAIDPKALSTELSRAFGPVTRMGPGGTPTRVTVGGQPFVKALAGRSTDDIARILARGGEGGVMKWLKDVPYLGSWLKRRTRTATPVSAGMKGAIAGMPKAQIRRATQTLMRKRPMGRTLVGGALAGLGALYGPSILGWLRDKVLYGGSSQAEAARSLQEKLRELEMYRAAAAVSANELREAAQAGRDPRMMHWDAFEAYRRGSPLTLPKVPGLA